MCSAAWREIPVITGYKLDGVKVPRFDTLSDLDRMEPVVTMLPGWNTDIMYLPTCDMYARLHVDAIDFGKNENLELLSRERDFYLCLFDNELNKIKEIKLPINTFNPYTGWCQLHDGIHFFCR